MKTKSVIKRRIKLNEVGLTKRELQILKILSQGNTNNEIAAKLFISVNTVKTHVKSIYEKLGAKNRTEATSKAQKNNLL